MKLQLLRQVKEAEDAGAKVVADAQAQAEAIVKDARREAEHLLADGKAAVDEARQKRLDEARATVEKEASKTIQEGHDRAAALRDGFQEGVDGVTDRILKILEESF